MSVGACQLPFVHPLRDGLQPISPDAALRTCQARRAAGQSTLTFCTKKPNTGAPRNRLNDRGMTESTDERQLVLRAQCGDREALEGLLLRLEDRLCRFVRGLVGEAASDDVLQDVYLKIWRNLKSLKEPGLLSPWAYRIASRTALDYLKRQRRWPEVRDSSGDMDDLPGPEAAAFPEIIGGMESLLDIVPPASRAVLLLHYRQDLSIEEAAAVLDIGIGTAKSRLAYGLACLRRSVRKGR